MIWISLPRQPDGFAQGDEENDADRAANQGGDQLRQPKGDGQSLQHGCFQKPLRQQAIGKHAADYLIDQQIQHAELSGGGKGQGQDPGEGQSGAAPVRQIQHQNKGEISQHDDGDGNDTGGNAQKKRQQGREKGHHTAAADAAEGDAEGQNRIDAGAGDQLPKGLRQCLQSDEDRQQNAGPYDPLDLFVHGNSFFLNGEFGDQAAEALCPSVRIPTSLYEMPNKKARPGFGKKTERFTGTS